MINTNPTSPRPPKPSPLLRFELAYKSASHVLGKQGIPVIALKGPHLAHEYYEKPETRPYADLDLLVPQERFHEAVGLLLRAGCMPYPWDPKRLATINGKYNWGFKSPLGIAIELHRDFGGYRRFRPDLPGMFARAVEFRFGRTRALGLAANDLLLQLCLHAGKSFFISIKQKHVMDIALVIKKSAIDWREFCVKAGAWGIRTACWLALKAARLQYDAPVPEAVMLRLSPGRLRRCWLAGRLDLSRFPMKRVAAAGLRRAQLGLLFALIDKKRHWLAFCYQYVRLFLADVALRIPIYRRSWMKGHILWK